MLLPQFYGKRRMAIGGLTYILVTGIMALWSDSWIEAKDITKE